MPFYNFYIDESGNRNPDQKPDAGRLGRDWFAIGGILVANEDINRCKEIRAAFVDRWNIGSPLHMTDMLGCHKGFSWLGRLSDEEHDRFWSEYKGALASMPVVGLACVIDRPGYVARGYLDEYNDKWLLCRSAFDIAVERAVKFGLRDSRKVGVIFEEDPGINPIIKGYHTNLRDNGLGFDAGRSQKYRPVSKAEFAETLSTIEHRPKRNPMLQIADSFLYSMARRPYDSRFHIYRRLRDSRRLANTVLQNEDIPTMGIKHYCFELHQSKRR